MTAYRWSRKVHKVFVIGGTTFAYDVNGNINVGTNVDPLGTAVAIERVMIDMGMFMATPIQAPPPPDIWPGNTGWQWQANVDTSLASVAKSPLNSSDNTTLITGSLPLISWTQWGVSSGVAFAKWEMPATAVAETPRLSPVLGTPPIVRICLRGEQLDGVGSALAGYTFSAYLTCYSRVLYRY